MPAEFETVKGALDLNHRGWNKYFLTILALNAVFLIDAVSGGRILGDQKDIPFLGLSIPRVLFSFTYILAFGGFVFWAATYARILAALVGSLSEQDISSPFYYLLASYPSSLLSLPGEALPTVSISSQGDKRAQVRS